MYKFVLGSIFALFCLSCALTPEIKAADEVAFTSAAGIPTDFNKGTFFWRMPEIDKDATLEYGIFLPDGKKCFQYTFKKTIKAGKPIRSDFKDTIFEGKHKQLQNSKITVKIKVDKGIIKFLSKPDFSFLFCKKIGAVQKKSI
jgi:hypothetical protein